MTGYAMAAWNLTRGLYFDDNSNRQQWRLEGENLVANPLRTAPSTQLPLSGSAPAFPPVFYRDHKDNRSDIHHSAIIFFGFLLEVNAGLVMNIGS